MRSLYDNIVTGAQIANAVATTASTPTSAYVDTLGYSTAVIQGWAGNNANANTPSVAFTLLESATSGGTYTAAVANDGNIIGFTLVPGNSQVAASPSGAARIEGLGLNRKRFLKVQIVVTATGGATFPVYGEIVLGRAQKLPAPSTPSTDY